MAEPTIDIAGAARATGLSVKALRGRVERGSLPATLIGGRRRIPVRALVDAGLLVTDRNAARPQQKAEVDVTALLERLERQAEEIGRLRAELEHQSAPAAAAADPVATGPQKPRTGPDAG